MVSRDELGAMAGMSGKTYEHAVEVLEKAPEPVVQAARLALRLKPVIAEKAKEKQCSGVNQYTKSLPQKSAEPVSPVTTRQELAKVAGVSHDTIAKVEKIERKAPEAVKKQLRTGEISINKAYNAAVMRFKSLYSVVVHKHILLHLKP